MNSGAWRCEARSTHLGSITEPRQSGLPYSLSVGILLPIYPAPLGTLANSQSQSSRRFGMPKRFGSNEQSEPQPVRARASTSKNRKPSGWLPELSRGRELLQFLLRRAKTVGVLSTAPAQPNLARRRTPGGSGTRHPASGRPRVHVSRFVFRVSGWSRSWYPASGIQRLAPRLRLP
jgi:hypothetical protein